MEVAPEDSYNYQGTSSGGKPRRWYQEVTFGYVLLWIVAVTGLVVGAVALSRSSGWGGWDNDWHRQVHGALLTRNRGDPSGSSISVAAVLDARQPFRFCSEQHYYTKQGRANDTLHKLHGTIDELTTQPLVDAWIYPLHISLDVEYNADLSSALSAEGRRLFGQRTAQKHITFSYNITTTYPFFHSIALRELEFDTMEETLLEPRSIPLCNNAAVSEAERCDKRAKVGKFYAIHGRKYRSLSTSRPVLAETKTTPSATAKTQNGGAAGKPKPPQDRSDYRMAEDEDAMYDMLLENQEREEEHVRSAIEQQIQSVMNNRIYNVVLYRRLGERQFNVRTSGSPTNGAPPYEEIALTVPLKRCN